MYIDTVKIRKYLYIYNMAVFLSKDPVMILTSEESMVRQVTASLCPSSIPSQIPVSRLQILTFIYRYRIPSQIPVSRLQILRFLYRYSIPSQIPVSRLQILTFLYSYKIPSQIPVTRIQILTLLPP